MIKSNLFKKAHALTKQIIKNGFDYKITFGACLHFLLNQANIETANAQIDKSELYINKYYREKYNGELAEILASLNMTFEQLEDREDQRDLVTNFRIAKQAEIDALKPKKASISKVRKDILKSKTKLSSYELGFINGLKGKRKLTVKQENWLRDIAKKLNVEIEGEFENRLSQKEKYSYVEETVCNCDMCVAERYGSESAGYFGSACAKWR